MLFSFCILAATCLAGSHPAAAGPNLEPVDRPNVVLMVADDQGCGDTGLDDHPWLETPHLRQLAADGFRFQRFYAAAPVCSPTRASILTGRHPLRMGVLQWGYPLRPQEVTMAECFLEAGYATGHFGKWHLGSLRPGSLATPSQAGFEDWLSAPNFFDNDPFLSRRGRVVRLEGESSRVTAGAALDWMTARAKEKKPFLCVIWFGSPHSPHEAGEADRQAILSRLPDEMPAARRRQLSHFLGEIRGIDEAVGMVRQGLRDLGIERETIVWYTSDNGALPGLGSTNGLRGRKNTLYEGGLRVPSLVSWPGEIPAGSETFYRANSSDLFPTLAGLCNITPPANRPLDGLDLAPVLADPDQVRAPGMGFWKVPAPGRSVPARNLLEAQWESQQKGEDLTAPADSRQAERLPDSGLELVYPESHAAWIDGSWKLHRKATDSGTKWELYQLEHDPGETTDLLERYPVRAIRMQRRLHSWMESVQRSYLGKDYRL